MTAKTFIHWRDGSIRPDGPQPKRARSAERGDVAGHAFHGNQWTGGEGGGDKPAELTDATLKRGWHLTDDPHFKPDPKFQPESNSLFGDLMGDQRPAGLYVGDPEHWMHAYGYERPYVAEVEGHVSDKNQSGYYGDLMQGDMRTVRVLPLDEYARETYHEPGWVETYHGDSPYRAPYEPGDKPLIPRDYVGKSTDQMTSSELADWEQKFHDYYQRSDGPHPAPKRSELLHVTLRGDVAGHAFHGNQWTGGEGGESPPGGYEHGYVARGMKASVDDVSRATAQCFADGKATADEVIAAVDDPTGVGRYWWGVGVNALQPGVNPAKDLQSSVNEAQDYAENAAQETATAVLAPDGLYGDPKTDTVVSFELPVVLVGHVPYVQTQTDQGYESDAALPPSTTVHLDEVRYSTGEKWVTLDATGRTVNTG